MRSELHAPERAEQGSLYLCPCGSLHAGECPIEYARYGIGSLDRHAARPRKARAPHRCDCAFTSPESADDNLLQRCGKIVTPGEIYVEIPRGDHPMERRLPSWSLTLECAVKYHSDTIVTGLDPDVKLGRLGSDEETQVA